MPDELSELLRRCHREELLPLARTLRIKPGRMGLGQLADAITATMRRRGANDLANAFWRQGNGPPYRTVLDGLCVRCGLPQEATTEEQELALLRWWLKTEWAVADEETRALIWRELNLGPAPPNNAEAVLAETREQWGARYGLGIGATTLTVLTPVIPPLGPFTGCLFMFWLTRPRDDVLLPALIEIARLRQASQHRITIGLVGSPSSGKDAAINALFGIDSGNIDPVAGSTTEVAIHKLDRTLYVVNTPGLGDIVESVTEEAKQVLGLIDVYVYLVNAQGGVQQRERTDYDDVVRRGRPVLAVVNKIDTIREADRARYLDDARAKLQAPEEDFLPAAFDPLPQLSEHPIGVHAVQEWLRDRLATIGKSTLPFDEVTTR